MDLRERREGQTHRHPWELARLDALRRILAHVSLPSHARVLDVGCGDGFASRSLLSDRGVGTLVGLDTNFSDADLTDLAARADDTEGSTEIRYVRSWEALAGLRFDMVLLLDVLEHMTEDVGFLRRIRDEHLTGGGAVLITVPAFGALFSAHDRFLQHHRRYDRKMLDRAAREAGLTPERAGYLFASLLLPRFASVLWERVSGSGRSQGLASWRGGAWLTASVRAALRLDNWILHTLGERGVVLPGLSTWALCRKPLS